MTWIRTPEQRDNAMRYGVCMTCGAPREAFHMVTAVAGQDVHATGLACPNGHTELAAFACVDPEADYAALAADKADRDRDHLNAETDRLEAEPPTTGDA